MASVISNPRYSYTPTTYRSKFTNSTLGFRSYPASPTTKEIPQAHESSRKAVTKKIEKSPQELYPVPKGDSPYAKAKQAEYIERDLKLSEMYLKQAIFEGDRTESALKDLAGLLHRQSRTDEACELLQNYSYSFTDQGKFANLLQNLKKQIVPSGKCLNKWLKVSGLRPSDTTEIVSAIFKDDSRILSITMESEETYYGRNSYAVVKFSSHSAARKTLEGFSHWGRYKIEWLNVTGEVVSEVYHNKPECRRDRRTFMHRLFWRDPEDRILPLPLDKYDSDCSTDDSNDEDQKEGPTLEIMLGKLFLSEVFYDDLL